MSSKSSTVSDRDLQAFVDGQLEGARQDRVAAAIACDPELARRVEELRGLNASLHVAYDGALDEPVPGSLLRTLMRRRPAFPLRIAAALAWMIVGGVMGGAIVSYTGQERAGGIAAARPLAREAAWAHSVYVPEVRHPVEVGANERDHLNAWLSKRLAAPVVAPDVRDAGYQLVGGRLLPDAGRPAAQFMYEDARGTRITLYVRAHGKRAREAAIRHGEDGDVGVVYWVDGPLAYALAGSIDRHELESVARTMYRALNP